MLKFEFKVARIWFKNMLKFEFKICQNLNSKRDEICVLRGWATMSFSNG
jgi:hypothetical protein